MDDNLKERLADMSALSQSRTPADALKYIEELEAKLEGLRLQVQHANHRADVAAKRMGEMADELTEALWTLEVADRAIMKTINSLDLGTAAHVFNHLRTIRTTIADLKGESDE